MQNVLSSQFSFDAGEVIFRQGETGDTAFLIVDGEVEILVQANGEERCVSTLGSGELVGEIALIDQRPRTATVRARNRTNLLQIDAKVIQELLAATDPVIRHLLQVVLRRFRATQGVLTPDFVQERGIELHYPVPTGPLHESATHSLAISQEVAQALLGDEFELHYQPIVRMSDAAPVSFEALIRWKHPKHGLIYPNAFLGVAEQTGQIRHIGQWTIERACRDWPRLAEHLNSDAATVSVNLSAKQLTEPFLIHDVQRILDKTGMDLRHLKLELTESLVIQEPGRAEPLLKGLVDLGIHLAIDDFGTGYSGLGALQRYPFGTVKIDRSFTSKILDDHQSREIVRATIQLGKALGVDVVAEGIETEDVQELLTDMGCSHGQGWHHGRPAPLSAK